MVVEDCEVPGGWAEKLTDWTEECGNQGTVEVVPYSCSQLEEMNWAIVAPAEPKKIPCKVSTFAQQLVWAFPDYS